MVLRFFPDQAKMPTGIADAAAVDARAFGHGVGFARRASEARRAVGGALNWIVRTCRAGREGHALAERAHTRAPTLPGWVVAWFHSLTLRPH